MMRTPPVSPPARPALITHTNFSFFSLSLSFLLSVLHHTRSFLAFPITLQITDRRDTRSIHDTIILRTKKLRDERTNERTNVVDIYTISLPSIPTSLKKKKKNTKNRALPSGGDTANRSPDVRRFRERSEQGIVRRSVREREEKSERLPHLGHVLRLSRVDRLQPSSKSLRGRS